GGGFRSQRQMTSPLSRACRQNRMIGTTDQAPIPHMDTIWIEISEFQSEPGPRDFRRRAACAAQPTGMLTTRRSRSAANARQARMSALGSGGKSVKTSARSGRRQGREHITDGDWGTTHARLPEANFRVYGDPVAVVHGRRDKRMTSTAAMTWVAGTGPA